MNILVINAGSSSVKYELFDMEDESTRAFGNIEKIGDRNSISTHAAARSDGGYEEKVGKGRIADHREAFKSVVNYLLDPDRGVIRDKSNISGVGHRVVHGGAEFHGPTVINEFVITAIEKAVPLAPLHNPANLQGIEVAREVFPHMPQVAVFDTAFHQTIPMKAFLYALPYHLFETHGIRRYGFQGTSHAYVAEKGAAHLGRSLDELKLITIHLGNGASMAAVKKGRCIDTTMGLTPLEGLVMGTRSGDIDPALPLFLAGHLGMALEEIDHLLNHESGLQGLCGTNDMREVIEKRDGGDERAAAALDIYTYRIRKYIGAFFAVLGSLDAVIFTAGIGENVAEIRARACLDLEKLGIGIDESRNNRSDKRTRVISPPHAEVKVLVVPTNEELRIAQETMRVLASGS
jgi:acetate kinase